jgi:hypothetical protein
MKSILLFSRFFLVIVILFAACRKNDSSSPDGDVPDKEYKFIRLLVSDGASKQITLVNPVDGSTLSFDASYPNASLYSTASRRFGALLFGSQNHVQFFDCGFEYHGDHVDMKGTPKLAYMTADGKKPTHYKSRGTETIIFNDGEGTLSVADENDFHVRGSKMKIIDAGVAPHHGAMAQFDNGNYAVTVQDPASALPGPHGVKIIDKNGQQIHPPALEVSRLHGNATDGRTALFGVEGGILVVSQNGEQRIISNPDGFGDVRLGTILEAPAVNKFIGFSALKGAYFIDIAKNEIKPILETSDIIQCKTDYTGNNVLLLLQNGNVKIFDLLTGSLKTEGNVISPVSQEELLKPALEATSRFIYITMPMSGELLKIKRSDFSEVTKIKVTSQPARLTILGYETNESH